MYSYPFIYLYIMLLIYGTITTCFCVLNDENYVVYTNLVICFHFLWKLLTYPRIYSDFQIH